MTSQKTNKIAGILSKIFKNDKLYIFFDMPKCAGNTIKENFYKNLKKEEILEIYKPPFKTNQEIDRYIISIPEREKQKIKLIIGHHVYYGIHKFFDKDPIYLTFIRNPIDRTISHYNYALTQYKVKKEKNVFPTILSSKNKIITFKKWLKENLFLHDMMCRMLYEDFYFTGVKKLEFSEIDSENMKKILKKFYFIGLVENYEKDISYVFKKLRLSKKAKKQNVSIKYIDPADKSLRNFTKDFLKLDLKLYRYLIKKRGLI